MGWAFSLCNSEEGKTLLKKPPTEPGLGHLPWPVGVSRKRRLMTYVVIWHYMSTKVELNWERAENVQLVIYILYTHC